VCEDHRALALGEAMLPLPPPDDDPAYTALLEAEAIARQALQSAQARNSPSAMTNAEWNLADASGAIYAYELGQAGHWNRSLRFVVRHYPDSLRMKLMELLGLDVLREDIRQLRADTDEIAEAVATLKAQHRRNHHERA
jgi:hypothetical protein